MYYRLQGHREHRIRWGSKQPVGLTLVPEKVQVIRAVNRDTEGQHGACVDRKTHGSVSLGQ